MWFTIPEKSRSYYYEKDISSNTVSPFTNNIEVVRKRLMIEGGNIIPKGRDIVINYYAPAMERVKIEFYDVNGRRVETIVNEKSGENGIYRRKIKTGDLKRGVYFIKYRSKKELRTEQIIITG